MSFSVRTQTAAAACLGILLFSAPWSVGRPSIAAAQPSLEAGGAAKGAESASAVDGGVQHCKPGPWGNVSYFFAYIEAPDYLLDYFPLPNTQPCWTVKAEDLGRFADMLKENGMADARRERILDERAIFKHDDSVCLYPSVGDVESITTEARNALYPELGLLPQNEYHSAPVHITSGNVDSWFANTGLRPEIIAKIKSLAWKRGDSLEFSDIPSVLSYAKSAAEAREIFRAFTRTRIAIVQVEVDSGADVEQLADYWRLPQQRKAVLPMLQSLQEASRSHALSVDICHLFPPFARKYLNTFPDLSLAANGRFPDCHWTSLNFFNDSPRNYYLNTALAADFVVSSYTPVEPPYRFGDVLMFQSGGTAVHSCVYIADELVFTKNGENLVTPWVLMRLQDLKKIYSSEEGTIIKGYRQKPEN
jgi:hypothetical protein